MTKDIYVVTDESGEPRCCASPRFKLSALNFGVTRTSRLCYATLPRGPSSKSSCRCSMQS